MSKLNENNFERFYTQITNFAPYQYQEKVNELLLSGKNVILTVPTRMRYRRWGGGKVGE